MSGRAALLTAIPVGLSVGVFGAVFGALAAPRLGVALTVLTSTIVFSGTVQFAVVSLLAAGAGAPVIVATAAALNARNLVLGGVIRTRMEEGRLGRAVAAWFLLDETVGLALSAGRQAGTVLVRTGALLGAFWLAGTVLGALGGGVRGVEPLAEAVFPVLFVALAAVAITSRSALVRTIVAAAATYGAARLIPSFAPVIPVVVAVLVAFVGRDEARET